MHTGPTRRAEEAGGTGDTGSPPPPPNRRFDTGRVESADDRVPTVASPLVRRRRCRRALVRAEWGGADRRFAAAEHVAAGERHSGHAGGFRASPAGTAVNPPPTGAPATPSATPSATASATLTDPTAAPPTGPAFQPLDLFATPSPPPARGAQPTDPAFTSDPRRPMPAQSVEWLQVKAAGRVALVGGKIVRLDAGANPLAMPATGAAIPAARTLDTTWTRWVVEPSGYGTDEKGNRFSNLNYWNLCSAGATTVALWYWQALTGHPNVTGTEGYFLEPYSAEAGSWPTPGPTVAVAGDGTRLGTYWSGSDTVNGFTANGRGFLMYMATKTQPPAWQTTGMVVYSRADGTPLYPTRGGPRPNIMTALNWEASDRDPNAWVET